MEDNVLFCFSLPFLMAYFVDKVGDVPERAGKRTRNDFDEASAVPALQQVPNKMAIVYNFNIDMTCLQPKHTHSNMRTNR